MGLSVLLLQHLVEEVHLLRPTLLGLLALLCLRQQLPNEVTGKKGGGPTSGVVILDMKPKPRDETPGTSGASDSFELIPESDEDDERMSC